MMRFALFGTDKIHVELLLDELPTIYDQGSLVVLDLIQLFQVQAWHGFDRSFATSQSKRIDASKDIFLFYVSSSALLDGNKWMEERKNARIRLTLLTAATFPQSSSK